MTIHPLPRGVQRFSLADLPPEPWRNGGGQTRTVAAVHVGDRLRWRVSAADIVAPGPFSVFDGVDRTAVLMRGPGLALQGPQERWVFEGIGAQAHFAGDTPLQATLGPSGPARLWNVMTDRATVAARVQVHSSDSGAIAPTASGVLVVLEGQLDVLTRTEGLRLTLGAEEGLVLTDVSEPLLLLAPAVPARWAVATFQSRG